MSALWIAVIAGALMISIDFAWRQLDRRGVQLSPARRSGSTLQTAIVVGIIVAVAWILDAAGVLGSVVSSPDTRVAVVVVILGLQVATIIALAMLARGRRPT
jgi:hypothetical protein